MFAAPVGPPDTAARLGSACDRVILLVSPYAFAAVGEWYDRFDQTSDEEVIALLKRRGGGVRVSTLPGIEEALRFRLPVELEPSAASQVAIPPVAE